MVAVGPFGSMGSMGSIGFYIFCWFYKFYRFDKFAGFKQFCWFYMLRWFFGLCKFPIFFTFEWTRMLRTCFALKWTCSKFETWFEGVEKRRVQGRQRGAGWSADWFHWSNQVVMICNDALWWIMWWSRGTRCTSASAGSVFVFFFNTVSIDFPRAHASPVCVLVVGLPMGSFEIQTHSVA